MITLAFDGWAQCRLATDPDPSDEPRGVSGWTFAVAGEPDLDRVIRLQPPGTVLRPLAPAIGVAVRAVSVDGAVVAQHALLGAAVDFLDEPVFEGRNGIVGEDALEPIVPFHLAVHGAGDLVLRREHRAAGAGGELLPAPPSGGADAQADIAKAIGDVPPRVFRARRRRTLEQLRDVTTDEVARVALDKRMRDFDDNVGDGIGEGVISFALRYVVVLQGAAGEVHDPAGALGATIDADAPWTADFWFGAFDADALCTFVKGTIALPVRAAP